MMTLRGGSYTPMTLPPRSVIGKLYANFFMNWRYIKQWYTFHSAGYSGEMTGTFGDSEQAAIAAFQTSAGLESTGFPDQVTLWKLLRSSLETQIDPE